MYVRTEYIKYFENEISLRQGSRAVSSLHGSHHLPYVRTYVLLINTNLKIESENLHMYVSAAPIYFFVGLLVRYRGTLPEGPEE